MCLYTAQPLFRDFFLGVGGGNHAGNVLCQESKYPNADYSVTRKWYSLDTNIISARTPRPCRQFILEDGIS